MLTTKMTVQVGVSLLALANGRSTVAVAFSGAARRGETTPLAAAVVID